MSPSPFFRSRTLCAGVLVLRHKSSKPGYLIKLALLTAVQGALAGWALAGWDLAEWNPGRWS